MLESLTTEACVSLMQLQSLIQTHCCAKRHWKRTHTHTHTHSLGWMPARVLGAKMRTVIGAEPGSMQWITHSLPAVQTRTHAHTQRHIHTCTKGGWKATSERSVPWWPWIFPRLSSATALRLKAVVQISHAGAHTNTPTSLIVISLSCRERKRERGGVRENKRELYTTGIKREKTSHPRNLLFSLSPPPCQHHSFPPLCH